MIGCQQAFEAQSFGLSVDGRTILEQCVNDSWVLICTSEGAVDKVSRPPSFSTAPFVSESKSQIDSCSSSEHVVEYYSISSQIFMDR